jgi:hypothetical protein
MTVAPPFLKRFRSTGSDYSHFDFQMARYGRNDPPIAQPMILSRDIVFNCPCCGQILYVEKRGAAISELSYLWRTD